MLKPGGFVCFFEQTVNTSAFDSEVHKKRTVEEYKNMLATVGFKDIKHKHVQRNPSYGISIWKKYSWLPKWSLIFLYLLEQFTVNRKKEFISYHTTSFKAYK